MNKYSDSGGRSFGSECSGRSSRSFINDENRSQFSDDLELRVNSRDIGKIIGMLLSCKILIKMSRNLSFILLQKVNKEHRRF